MNRAKYNRRNSGIYRITITSGFYSPDTIEGNASDTFDAVRSIVRLAGNVGTGRTYYGFTHPGNLDDAVISELVEMGYKVSNNAYEYSVSWR